MTLEIIQCRQFSDPDRAAVQESVARAVEKDPDVFIDRYLSMEQSLGGRYVSADLFKETFEEYCASKDSRNRYNAPVHKTPTDKPLDTPLDPGVKEWIHRLVDGMKILATNEAERRKIDKKIF
jgi:hypothetical protein